ncbi:proto-oncogene Mas-like [Anolis carolinensis]|uniref:proto-oncogene Mas-like n=1 Tax=Anolis carolinensis TaxID=28377 RepID=UPI00020382F4
MVKAALSFPVPDMFRQSQYDLSWQEKIMISWMPFAILGFIGNGIVTYFFWHRQKRSRFFLYFQNITIANFSVLIYVFVYFHRLFLRLRIKNFFEHIVQTLQLLGNNTRFYLLAATCVERWFLVYRPVWVKHRRPQYTSAVVVSILWIVASITSMVDHLACSPAFFITTFEYELYCMSFTVIRIILELGLLIAIVFCSAAILKRSLTQSMPPERLDVTILATVLLYLTTDTPDRIAYEISIWFDDMDIFALILFTQLFDTINCAVIPFIFFIVGCWKKPSDEPVSLFLERALMFEENRVEGTPVQEEQA